MGKFSSGPDWTDIATMISAMCALHGCEVSLTVTASTQGHNGSVHTRLSAQFPRVPKSDLPLEVAVEGDWPRRSHAEFAGAVFADLYVLDFRIGEMYRAEPMFTA